MGPIQGSVKALALSQQGPDFDISADQAPDAIFSNKGHRRNEAKGIVQIMTMVIEDVNDEIRNGMKAEEDSQLAYEKQMKAAEDLVAQLEKKVVDLNSLITKRSAEKVDEEA